MGEEWCWNRNGLLTPTIVIPLLPKRKRISWMKRDRDHDDQHHPNSNVDHHQQQPSTDTSSPPPAKKMRPGPPKRKVAMCFGYIGTRYSGLQIQTGDVRTVESVLHRAIADAGGISDRNAEALSKVGWMRASRTDKGVHAIANIVNLKMQEAVPWDAMPERINAHLPDDVRVHAIQRVTGSFNSKRACDGRKYLYLTPSFVFQPLSSFSHRNNNNENNNNDNNNISTHHHNTTSYWDYRIPEDKLAQVRRLLRRYVGTNNYHNFTSFSKFRRGPKHAAAHRYVHHFTCSDPFLVDGREYVWLQVSGQSFIFNQIRKMIGLVIAITRGMASEDDRVMDRALSPDVNMDVPRAPGLGLILKQCMYGNYNKRHGAVHGELDWDGESMESMQVIRRRIVEEIVATETRTEEMAHWLDEIEEIAERHGLCQEKDDSTTNFEKENNCRLENDETDQDSSEDFEE